MARLPSAAPPPIWPLAAVLLSPSTAAKGAARARHAQVSRRPPPSPVAPRPVCRLPREIISHGRSVARCPHSAFSSVCCCLSDQAFCCPQDGESRVEAWSRSLLPGGRCVSRAGAGGSLRLLLAPQGGALGAQQRCWYAAPEPLDREALILATTALPMLRRSAARSRGRAAPRADRGGRTRRRHLLWTAAAAGCGGVCRCTSGSPSRFRAAGSRVGRWSSTGRCPPITSRRARVSGEDTGAPLLAHRVGRLAGCKGKSWPCVLVAAGTAVCRPPAPEDAAMGSAGTEAAAGGRR